LKINAEETFLPPERILESWALISSSEDLREAAAGALSSRCGLGGFGSLGTVGGETETSEHGINLLQLLGIFLVDGGDFLRDLLLDSGLGLENLLGGFLLESGELLEDISLGVFVSHGFFGF